jgi:hypothetical protein
LLVFAKLRTNFSTLQVNLLPNGPLHSEPRQATG